MITDEMICFESGEPSADERAWFAFVREVEALLGLTRLHRSSSALDGEDSVDGYSLDTAYRAFRRGTLPLEYAQEVNLNRHALGLSLLVPVAAEALAHLIDALRKWKCPSCDGSGKYRNNSAVTGTSIVSCRKCAGRGLHPVAFAALEKVRLS